MMYASAKEMLDRYAEIRRRLQARPQHVVKRRREYLDVAADGTRVVHEPPTLYVTDTDRIVAEVCAKHGMAFAAIRGRSRQREVSAARHELAWRLYVERGLTLAQIGRKLGGRDHSTVAASLKRTRAILALNAPEEADAEPRS